MILNCVNSKQQRFTQDCTMLFYHCPGNPNTKMYTSVQTVTHWYCDGKATASQCDVFYQINHVDFSEQNKSTIPFLPKRNQTESIQHMPQEGRICAVFEFPNVTDFNPLLVINDVNQSNAYIQ